MLRASQTSAPRTSQRGDLGTFERSHLLERLSVLYIGPASLRELAPAERPADEQAAYRMALTASERLAAYGYRLDERSIIALVGLYAKTDLGTTRQRLLLDS